MSDEFSFEPYKPNWWERVDISDISIKTEDEIHRRFGLFVAVWIDRKDPHVLHGGSLLLNHMKSFKLRGKTPEEMADNFFWEMVLLVVGR